MFRIIIYASFFGSLVFLFHYFGYLNLQSSVVFSFGTVARLWGMWENVVCSLSSCPRDAQQVWNANLRWYCLLSALG